MTRTLSLALAALALTSITACASGDVSDTFGKSSEIKAVAGGPPAGYEEQHWISPNGCSYSRAQMPGRAPTWHLILNGAHVGLTNAHRGCTAMYQGS